MTSLAKLSIVVKRRLCFVARGLSWSQPQLWIMSDGAGLRSEAERERERHKRIRVDEHVGRLKSNGACMSTAHTKLER